VMPAEAAIGFLHLPDCAQVPKRKQPQRRGKALGAVFQGCIIGD
jgi:hypothetical protein